jgi:hypothetical protein
MRDRLNDWLESPMGDQPPPGMSLEQWQMHQALGV